MQIYCAKNVFPPTKRSFLTEMGISEPQKHALIPILFIYSKSRIISNINLLAKWGFHATQTPPQSPFFTTTPYQKTTSLSSAAPNITLFVKFGDKPPRYSQHNPHFLQISFQIALHSPQKKNPAPFGARSFFIMALKVLRTKPHFLSASDHYMLLKIWKPP